MSLVGIASIIGAGAALIGGIGGFFENSRNRRYNQGLQVQSQDFQREMFANENAEYDRRFNMQTEYNDPRAVMGRFSQAGVNPIYGTGGNSTQTFGAPDPSVQSPPSPVTPPYVNMSASGDLASSLEKMGSFIGSLASARKDVAEGTSIAKLLDGQIENQQLSNLLKQQEVIGFSIDNIIKGQTGLKKALMDIRLAQSQVNLNNFLGYESEAKKELIDWQSFAEQAKVKLSNAEYLKLMQLLPLEIKNQEEYNNVLKEEGKKYRAEGAQAYAAAGKYEAESETENVLREHRVNLTKNQVAEAAKRVEMSEVEIRKKLAELCQSEDKAKFLNEYPKIKRVISFLESLGDAASLGVLKGIISVK